MADWLPAIGWVIGMGLIAGLIAMPFFLAVAWFISEPPNVRAAQIKRLISREGR